MNQSGEKSLTEPKAPKFSRRALLAGAAAASAVAAGAWRLLGSQEPPRAIEGGIVGASHEWGHRLRGGSFPTPRDERAVAVAIVGGGVAGLSAAWRLSRAGFHDYEVLELEPSAGGNSRWGESEVTAFPWGAHYLPIPDERAVHVRELLAELGVLRADGSFEERWLCHAPVERLFQHGRWQDGLYPRLGMSGGDVRALEAFRVAIAGWRAWRDGEGRPAFAIPMALSSPDPVPRALDRISMADWLAREGLASAPLAWYVDYCCRDDYGTSAASTSAWAGLHYFAARDVEDAPILTWPEGNGWLVRRLLERLGDRVTTGALVHRVRPEGDCAVVDHLDTATGEARRVRCRRVVYALPRFTAPRVIEGYAAPWLGEFGYAPWVVANVTVDRLPDEASWDNVIHGSPSLGYVVATHQSLASHPGPSVLTWYRPFAELEPAAARARMLETPWEGWVEEILADLGRAHREIRALVRRVDVMLWGHAMIRPRPGFVWGEARAEAGRPFGPVHFAHSDMSGLSIFEEAQYQGVCAADRVLDELG